MGTSHESVKIAAAKGNFKTVTLTNPAVPKALVEIFEYGGHIVRWVDAKGNSKLYLSSKSHMDGSKAVRGGIPICFPQFGNLGPLEKQHGFARSKKWTLERTASGDDGPKAIFVLEDDEETRSSAFPYSFCVQYEVQLDNTGSLKVVYSVKNKGDDSFSFTTALHAYFNADVKQIAIEGLQKLKFIDKTDDRKEKVEDREKVTIIEETDRIYLDTPNSLKVPAIDLLLHKRNLPDATVWNPWIEKTKGMSDMPDDDWQNFCCVEAAATRPVELKGQNEWTASLLLESTA